MAMSEIDSFVLKFKHLLSAGRNACLKVESNAGKAIVTLQADLGDLPPIPHIPPQGYHQRSRNGPARQRRRQRRAEARDAHAAVIVAEQVSDAANVTEEIPAEEAEKEIEVNKESETVEAENTVFNLKDEFCPDIIYEEIGPDHLIEEFVVNVKVEYDHEIKDIEEMIDYNLKIAGLTMKKIEMEKNSDDAIELLVKVEETTLKKLKGFNFPHGTLSLKKR